MKVEIVTKEKENKQPTYPYLGISEVETIVLFTAPKSGVCLQDEYNGYHKGKFRTDWLEESNFQPFEDKLVLQN